MPSPLETVQTAESQDPVVKARQDYLRKIDALEKQQNALLESLGTRSPGDTLLSMAQGFLAPTRTGSFGESFGSGIGQLRGSQAAEEKRAEELAKMRLAIGAQQLGTEKDKLQMTKDLALAQGIQGMLGLGGAPQVSAGHPMVAGAPGASVMATPESGAFARPSVSPTAPTGFAQRLSPQGRGMIGALAGSDPTKALDILIKGESEDAKISEAVKTAEYYLQGLPENLRAVGRQAAASAAVFGKPEEGLKAIADLGQAYRKGYITQDIFVNALSNLPSLTTMRGAATSVAPATPATPTVQPPVTQPPVAPQRTSMVAPTALAAPSTAVSLAGGPQAPAAVAAPTERRGAQIPSGLTPEQVSEIEAEKQKTIAKGEVEQQLDLRKNIMGAFNSASDRLSDANRGYDIVKGSPGAFGLFATPGISSAIGQLVQNGIQVGNFRVGMPDIQSAALSLGGTQQEINARSKFMQIAVNASLGLAANAKGSVSNFERDLFTQASLTPNDSPNAIMYKLELQRARAQFDRMIGSEYQKFEKARMGSAEDFAQSDRYQALRNSYDNALKQIQSAYSGK